MANKIKVRLILELHAGGMSNDMIAKTRHMSRTSISTVLRIAREKNITYESVQSMDDSALYKMFFPDDSRTIFRLAMTAGYILDSGSVREHLREDKTK
jgi:hypothetical protein